MLANSSNNVNRVATMSAYDQYSSSVSIAGFAEKCDRDSRGCERSCLTVKRAFEKYCSRASAQERAQAQQLVGQAEGDKNKLYCVAVLGRKVEQARAQSKVMGETAEQHAQIHDQSTGQGGAGGDGGMGAGLAGLLQNMQQNQQKKKEEMEALKKAHEAAIAAEGLSQACLRPEFRDLEKCQCRGLTADQCRAKMPTPAPNVRAIQENMLRAPAQYGP